MTHDEYEKKKLALLAKHLYAAAVADVTLEEATDLARLLADALDRLALEIDPFAGEPEGAPAQGGSRHGR